MQPCGSHMIERQKPAKSIPYTSNRQIFKVRKPENMRFQDFSCLNNENVLRLLFRVNKTCNILLRTYHMKDAFIWSEQFYQCSLLDFISVSLPACSLINWPQYLHLPDDSLIFPPNRVNRCAVTNKILNLLWFHCICRNRTPRLTLCGKNSISWMH